MCFCVCTHVFCVRVLVCFVMCVFQGMGVVNVFVVVCVVRCVCLVCVLCFR